MGLPDTITIVEYLRMGGLNKQVCVQGRGSNGSVQALMGLQ
jgi:hypothetical protein